jgi:hypothetical protein
MNGLAKRRSLMLKCFFWLAITVTTVYAVTDQASTLRTLKQLEWKNRVLIVLSKQPAVLFKKLIKDHSIAINERDLVLFVIDRTSQMVSNYSGGIDASLLGSLESKLPDGNAAFALIGKDGGLKYYGNQLDIVEVFNEIDRMPMRRWELTKHSNR